MKNVTLLTETAETIGEMKTVQIESSGVCETTTDDQVCFDIRLYRINPLDYLPICKTAENSQTLPPACKTAGTKRSA